MTWNLHTMRRSPSIGPARKHLVGLTYITATVESLDKAMPPWEIRLLVDTGAIDCLLPAAVMKSAGITPAGSDLYELADGQSLRLQCGWVRFNLFDTYIIAKAVFGPEGSEPLFGAIALESAGLTVDAASQTLKHLT